jgi:hypothetical protein
MQTRRDTSEEAPSARAVPLRWGPKRALAAFEKAPYTREFTSVTREFTSRLRSILIDGWVGDPPRMVITRRRLALAPPARNLREGPKEDAMRIGIVVAVAMVGVGVALGGCGSDAPPGGGANVQPPYNPTNGSEDGSPSSGADATVEGGTAVDASFDVLGDASISDGGSDSAAGEGSLD